MRPGAGAFAPPPVTTEKSGSSPQVTPRVTPGVDADFLQQLQQLGVLQRAQNGAPGAMPQQTSLEKGQTPPPSVPNPLTELSRLTGQKAPQIPGGQSAPPQPNYAPRPTKAKFVPGKPGAPKSGMTAHQMMRDPQIVGQLQSEVAAWEAQNPGRKLMGSHMAEILAKVRPGTTAAQSRTALRLLNKMAAKETSMAERYQRGAYNAMRG